MNGIAAGLQSVQGRITQACRRRGRNPEEVTLVAISKRQPVEAIQEAYDAGQRDFGENYAAELASKASQLPDDIRWHFTGHLQRNKVNALVPHVSFYQSIDAIRTAQAVDKRVGRAVPCLVQVNISGESRKSGIEPDDVESFLDQWTACGFQRLQLSGLMGISEPVDVIGAAEVARQFRTLAELAERHKASFPEAPTVISMGMTDDFELAIEAGSTMVRVGRAIFGERR